MRSALVLITAIIWQSVQADSPSRAEPEIDGRICIASVEAPNDDPKTLSNPVGENPDITYSVKVADHSPITISRESGVWLNGLKIDSRLPVIIYENGDRAASFFIHFTGTESSKCLFMNTLYRTWQVWDWDRVGRWCDCGSLDND